MIKPKIKNNKIKLSQLVDFLEKKTGLTANDIENELPTSLVLFNKYIIYADDNITGVLKHFTTYLKNNNIKGVEVIH